MQGKPSLWIVAAVFLAIVAAGWFIARGPNFHPYVVIQFPDSLKVAFLQRPQSVIGDCEATANRIAQATLAQCGTCQLIEKLCLDQLDSRQRKILSGQPVDIPVMRTPGGAVAFLSSSPAFADEACREAESQTARKLPGSKCMSAGAEGIALSLAKINGNADTDKMPGLGELFGIVLLATGISLLICYLIIRSERLHGRFSHDMTATGPQKFHVTPTPRIGGVAMAAGLAGAVLALDAIDSLSPAAAYGLTMLALSAIPAFAGGFGEDVTKRVGVLARLMLTFAAGVFASLLVGATLDSLDMPGLDTLLQWPIFAIAFTAFAVGGIANSINIIDGYNGLAGGYSVIVLAALAWVAGQVGDPVVLTASLAMLGALLGFLVWNYPKGKIFLGDGGAYLLGFWLAELSVLLVVRNPDVSPWFPMLLLAYPVFETFFSIYRKTYLRGQSAGEPDGLHIHMLIYKRLVRIGVGSKDRRKMTRRNSVVALYVWAGTTIFILPSLVVWSSTAWLLILAFIFSVAYVWLYLRLVRWRAPAWMITSSKVRGS